MQNSGEEARPAKDLRMGAGKKTCVGAKGRLPNSSPTDVNCIALPQAFHFRSCYQVIGARGQWGSTPSQATAHFCAHPQAAVVVPTAIRSPPMGSGGTHICTAPGAQPRVPANTSTVVHACTGARPSGRALSESGEVGANSQGPQRSTRKHCGAAAPPGVPPSPSYRCSLSRFLSPSLPRPFSRSRSCRLPSTHPAKPRSPAGTYL